MYFLNFPIVNYPLKDGDSFRYVLARNITRRIVLSEGLKGAGAAFISYDVKDGEKPEQIAEKLYGDPFYHWLVLLANDIIDPYEDWHRSDSAMEQYIEKKYSGYSVYFTNASNGFLYSSQFLSGATLSQGTLQSTITDYFPTLCKINVSSSAFAEGSAKILGNSGGVFDVTIHRIDRSYISAHHFEIKKGTNDIGVSDVIQVDPLSQQTGLYSYIGGPIGATTDQYPSYTNNVINYSPPSATVDFHETYIGRYMGVVGDKVDTYAVSNFLQETISNNNKKTIKLVHPRFKKAAMMELESLLRV